jgi:hypothetical protein
MNVGLSVTMARLFLPTTLKSVATSCLQNWNPKSLRRLSLRSEQLLLCLDYSPLLSFLKFSSLAKLF